MSVAINNFSQPIFDVVEYIRKLRSAGVSQEIAEIQGQAIAYIINNILKQTEQKAKDLVDSKEVATKGDIREVEAKIEQTKLELQKELITLKSDLLKWQISVGITATIVVLGGMFTMLKLMFN